MSSANLRSTEALKDVKTSLVKFGEQADMALTEVDMVARRVVEWLQTVQPQHWKAQTRRWEEKVAEARNNLQAKRASTFGGQRPDTTLEEKELRRCEAQLRHAQTKAKACKKWAKVVEDEIDEYRGRTAQLGRAVDVDIPKAMHALDQMHASLESYMNLRQPSAKREAEAAMVGAQGGGSGKASVTQQVQETEDEFTVEELIAMRDNTPTRFKRDSVPVNLPEGLSYDDAGVAKSQADLLEVLRIKGEPAEPAQKVLLAEGALEKPLLYLERVRSEGNDKDSGWYIGPVDRRVKQHEALTVGELYEIHPALVAIMALPADHLAVVDGTRVVAVLNAQDEKLKV